MILLFLDRPIPQGGKDKPETFARQRPSGNEATPQFPRPAPTTGVQGCCCLIQKNTTFNVYKGAV